MITKQSKGLDFSRRKLNPNKLLKRDLVWLHVNRCKKHGIFYSQHPQCLFNDIESGFIKPPFYEKIAFFDIEAVKEYANWGYVMCYSIKPIGEKPYSRWCRPRDLKKKDWDKWIMMKLCTDLRKYDRVVVYWGKDMRWDIPYVRTRTLIHLAKAIKEGNEAEIEALRFPEYQELFVYDLFDPVKAKLRVKPKSLGYVSRMLQIPAKETWLSAEIINGAMNGDKDNIARMVKHCEEDVCTTEDLYNVLHIFSRVQRTSI